MDKLVAKSRDNSLLKDAEDMMRKTRSEFQIKTLKDKARIYKEANEVLSNNKTLEEAMIDWVLIEIKWKDQILN